MEAKTRVPGDGNSLKEFPKLTQKHTYTHVTLKESKEDEEL